jgi:hypothetical protein
MIDLVKKFLAKEAMMILLIRGGKGLTIFV